MYNNPEVTYVGDSERKDAMGISKRRVVGAAVVAVVAPIGTASVFSPQIAAPSPAIPASTPPDPMEITR